MDDPEQTPSVPSAPNALWPDTPGHRVLFLLDASSSFEEELLKEWIDDHRPSGAPRTDEALTIPSSRRRYQRKLDPRLEAALAVGDDPLLAPLRVVWQPAQRGGVRVARFSDLLTFADPRDPGSLRQRWIIRRHPDRVAIVAGEPAPLSELRHRWQSAADKDAAQTVGVAEFVARQAALALERAERRLRGARYKVPRFVHEEILNRPACRGGIVRLAREVGSDEETVKRDAARYLHEIAATHSTYVIDLVANLIRLLYRQGYGALHYDRAGLAQIYSLAQRHPVVFLPSHKSNLDHLVLQYALYENGHPPNHTAGGINMNFFGVGPLMRRSGVFFIRRTFKANEPYKFVLRQYIDYLIEKRFPLEWYIEGGRSRSGKLLPPRFGILAYVVDAFRRGKSEDVFLIPVSIAYDQISDVGDYATEQRGGAKERENFGWFLRVVRRLRRRYGNIHIRFGIPVSLAEQLGPPNPEAEPNPDEDSLALQKLAFEVSVRINRATPLTPTSLVTLALLGVPDRALTVDEAVVALHNLVEYAERRPLPTSGGFDLTSREGVRGALDVLVQSGVVSRFDGGIAPVYSIGPEQHLAAAYYRNTIIHFFVNLAICELSLLKVANDGEPGDGTAAFWNEAMQLRDLLKFEFFFADKDRFRDELMDELASQDAEWESFLQRGAAGARELALRSRPHAAHRVLRPFVEAYRVVADALLLERSVKPLDEAAFHKRCLGLGKQYHLQRRIRNAESISKVLFETGLKLARNRALVEPTVDVMERRRLFAEELRDVIRRVDQVGGFAANRFTVLLE